jgi:5'-3' exoribonuclease 1
MLRREQDALLYEISSMRVAGEGEIKLVKSIQQRLANPRFNGHSHCIVTEDSDALLLAMTLFGQGKGAGCASNPEFQVFVLSGNAVFSARLFDALLLSSLPRGASLDSARRDFIGLSAMMGNDYIFGSKLGVKNSWRAYLELRGTYHFRDTSLFLMPPDREPDGRKKKDVPANVKRPKSGVNWHFLKQLARKLIDPKFDKLKVQGISRSDAKQKVKQVYEYMYGVEWMMDMYFDGECSDFSYFSFTMGPENLDLLLLPEKYAIDCDPFKDQKRAEASFYNRRPITPLAYSLAVIPRGGRAMLSENVRPLVDPGSPIQSLFVHDYCVQCIQHRMHVSPMEHAMQNATLLQHRDPGYNELIATNAQFSQFSKVRRRRRLHHSSVDWRLHVLGRDERGTQNVESRTSDAPRHGGATLSRYLSAVFTHARGDGGETKRRQQAHRR